VSIPHRVRGVKILKAVSSSTRLQILNLFFDKGPLSYSELMSSLKMNPSRDAGRFAYHLKFLLKADLIEADVEARKYCLTDLGKMVIDVADRVEKKASKQKGMLVRTSRFALEEFDANKIANSLIKEAKMSAELAQKVAKEAERQLLKSKTKYLTAPLVREVVNAILIEKGLEEQRNKLTRLGLPVHEVAALVETKSKASQESTSILETAGNAVFKEYTLLNVFPRDVADAHLSGMFHINGLSSWILKPKEAMHDLRFFFQNGLDLEKTNAIQLSYPAPQNSEAALATVFNILLHGARETSETQTFDYLNVFLAPYAKGLESSKLRDCLRLFILNSNMYANVSLGLELTVPDFLAEKPAIGASEKNVGKYGDFAEESQLLASLIIDIMEEQSAFKPIFNPKIIVKMRSQTFVDARAKAILLKAHTLASEKGILYFANLTGKDQPHTVFSASGDKLGTELSGDWEIDTLRTGCLGSVTINLPRIAHEAEKDKPKFFEILRERLEMATHALEIKHRTLKQHGQKLLPFLMQDANGDKYFRLENCSWIINFAGFKETMEAFCEKNADVDAKTLEFTEETVQAINEFTQKTGRKRGKRLLPAVLPSFEASERLAQLDIERYGVAKVRFSGTREKPFYSTVNRLTLQGNKASFDSPIVEKLQKLHAGGSLAVIELGEVEHKPEDLMSVTEHIIESNSVEFFAYDRKMTYCVNCKKSWFGLLPKCPSCGAVGILTILDRFASV
jgi:ribonucleoside-triphosphate reductase (formate)